MLALCAIPGFRRRLAEEPDPRLHARPGRCPWPAAGQQAAFPAVAEQLLIHRAPPWASGPVRSRRGEHPSADLPPHESHLGPAVRPDLGPGPVLVQGARELEPPGGIIADSAHQRGRLLVSGHGHPPRSTSASTSSRPVCCRGARCPSTRRVPARSRGPAPPAARFQQVSRPRVGMQERREELFLFLVLVSGLFSGIKI